MRYRIVDNNGQWSTWHKTKKEALLELKRQREFDECFHTYALEVNDGYEWLTVKVFKEGDDSSKDF